MLGESRLIKGNKGVARVAMPQLGFIPKERTRAFALPRVPLGGVDVGPLFWDHLVSKGARMIFGLSLVAKLRATQKELNCAKVEALWDAIAKGELAPQCLFTAQRGFIVDGHHRWAAELLTGLRKCELRSREILTSQVDIPICDVIEEANKFVGYYRD